MHSRKGETGLGPQSSVLSVQLHLRLPANERYGIAPRASGRAIGTAHRIAPFHHAASPKSHNGDILAREQGLGGNERSPGRSKGRKADRAVAASSPDIFNLDMGDADRRRGPNPLLWCREKSSSVTDLGSRRSPTGAAWLLAQITISIRSTPESHPSTAPPAHGIALANVILAASTPRTAHQSSLPAHHQLCLLFTYFSITNSF